MMKDGIYSDTNMALTLETDCQASDPIVFLAAPGANPVFDGGYSAPLVIEALSSGQFEQTILG